MRHYSHDRISMVIHYSDVIMKAMASSTTGVSIVCSTVCSGADLRKHQSSASLTFVRGLHRWPVDSPHKGPVAWKMFPFDDAIMCWWLSAFFGARSWANTMMTSATGTWQDCCKTTYNIKMPANSYMNSYFRHKQSYVKSVLSPWRKSSHWLLK